MTPSEEWARVEVATDASVAGEEDLAEDKRKVRVLLEQSRADYHGGVIFREEDEVLERFRGSRS